MSHWFQLLSIYLRIAMSDTEIAWYFDAAEHMWTLDLCVLLLYTNTLNRVHRGTGGGGDSNSII